MLIFQDLVFLAVFESRLEPGDWDWTAISAVATGLASLITAVTIVFIFLQTRATRKAAEQAERSADAAYQALEHSQKQLDISHRQHMQSAYMAAEAVKARIDTEMPRLLVQSATVALGHGWGLDQNGEPKIFVEPANKMEELAHVVKFQIKNDGPRSAKLRYSEPIQYHTLSPAGAESIQQIIEAEQVIPLSAGDTLNGSYVVRSTVGEWIDRYEARERREEIKGHQFTIRCLTDADTGANELHHISLAGTALVPLPEHRGAWVHRTTEDMKEHFFPFLEPVERTYFLSRRRNEMVPNIHWTSFSDDELRVT